jgi:GAF domain-containing protein
MAHNEVERVMSVKRFEKFDFALHNGLRGILEIAADIYQTPVAFITLLNEEEQLFKVKHGFDVFTMPRDTSFCTHTILLHEPMIVCDALHDQRFAENPLVTNVPNIRFYAGAALSSYDGMNVGTLCVMDNKPKEVPADKRKLLLFLAKQAIHLMELEINYKRVNYMLEQAEEQNATLKEIAFIQSYEFRQPLAKVKGLINEIKTNNYKAPEEAIQTIADAVDQLDTKIEEVEIATELARNKFIMVT